MNTSSSDCWRGALQTRFFVACLLICANGIAIAQPLKVPDFLPARGPEKTLQRKVTGLVITPDGKPVPNAIIVRDFGVFAGLTDHDGNFEISLTHRAAKWAMPIYVLHPTKPLSRVVALPFDQNRPKIQLQTEGNVIGKLLDEDGSPLANTVVELQATFLGEQNGQRNFVSTRSELMRTLSREDGTFRFQGVPVGFSYRARVAPAFLSGQTALWREKHTVLQEASQPFGFQFGDRATRKPLVIPRYVLAEIDKANKAIGNHPKTLLPIRGKVIGRTPALDETLSLNGRPVLLTFVANRSSFGFLNALHKAFSPSGLEIVCIINGDLEISQPLIKELQVARSQPLYTVVVDDGTIAAAYGVDRYTTSLLYGSNEKLQPLSAKKIATVRHHMIYGEAFGSSNE